MCCEQVRLFKSQSTGTQGPTKAFRFYSFLVSDWSALSENLLWLAENDDPGGPVGHYRVYGWLSPAIGTAAWHTNVDGFKISSLGPGTTQVDMWLSSPTGYRYWSLAFLTYVVMVCPTWYVCLLCCPGWGNFLQHISSYSSTLNLFGPLTYFYFT